MQVAAASLLDHRGSAQTHYHIYCVCTKEAAVVEEDLRQIVAARDPGSELTIRVADNPYADSYQVRGISAGTYLRLELHRLLPEVDKILYTDVDILFQGSLRELWETPLEGKFLAAVRGGANLADQWARAALLASSGEGAGELYQCRSDADESRPDQRTTDGGAVAGMGEGEALLSGSGYFKYHLSGGDYLSAFSL